MDKKTYIEEEAFIVQHSGEIPEIAFQGSLYFLTEDPDGPVLKLDASDILPLKQSVAERYRAIILRDLDPKNRDKRIYRGLARCVVNWQRLRKFCSREHIDIEVYRTETADALQVFLQRELADVQSRIRSSCINCSAQDIEKLADSLGLSMDLLPEGWQGLCKEEN